jgi:hypothetical protein
MQYARTSDGVSIACAEAGEGKPFIFAATAPARASCSPTEVGSYPRASYSQLCPNSPAIRAMSPIMSMKPFGGSGAMS